MAHCSRRWRNVSAGMATSATQHAQHGIAEPHHLCAIDAAGHQAAVDLGLELSALVVVLAMVRVFGRRRHDLAGHRQRSEEHTSELQSLMRISYAVFCLKKKKT